MTFTHEMDDAKELFEVIGNEKRIDPYLVEKDYWIMHALWGLQQQGFDFELKGGTSLSKGYKIIDRFSEDIDIKIMPDSGDLPMGKNQDKETHIQKREQFFNQLADRIDIPDMYATRDTAYDDIKFRSAGIRLTYNSFFAVTTGVKDGILLEVGFDTTTPNEAVDIDSWAYAKAAPLIPDLTDNTAKAIKCYLPEYTFVEKLQAITRKARQQQEASDFGSNFLRHFYDIHQLFGLERVKKFIVTDAYKAHKLDRFKGADNPDLKSNLAFNLDVEPALIELYRQEFLRIRSLFISGAPTFDEIYSSIIQIREIG